MSMDRSILIFNKVDENTPSTVFFIPYTTPFAFLVTVILSASSTDKRAIENSKALFETFPDERALSSASEEEIEKIIHSSGLSRVKARNIKALSEIVLEEGIGSTREELERLPGVGEKTASCFLSRVYNEPSVVVDTHFERTSYRLGLTDTHNRSKAMREIMDIYEPKYWNRLSDCINYLGRTFCRPKPNCENCYMNSICLKNF